MFKIVYLIRGLPGSGKTTLAKRLAQTRPKEINRVSHFEADMFFEDEEGNYKFDKDKLSDAHKWCADSFAQALERGDGVVIVSNTFTRLWEIKDYIQKARECGYKVNIICTKGNYGSIHGVPQEAVDRMEERFEDIEGEYIYN